MTATTKTRRPNGGGSIFKDPNTGRYVGMLDLGRDPSGKRQRRKVTGKTPKEVQRKLDELKAAQAKGQSVRRQPRTVGEIASQWLSEEAPRTNQASTMVRLTKRVHDHLIASIGHVRVDRLGVDEIDAWLKAEAASGHAERTIQDYLSDLRRILEWAFGRDEPGMSKNVARFAKVPYGARKSEEKRSLTLDQRAALYVALEGERLGAYFVVLGEMGLRPGEADGLRWTDLDLNNGTIFIRCAMKRGEGGEALGLGAPKTPRKKALKLTPTAIAALRRRRLEQHAERLRVGPAWSNDDRWHDLVFTSELGTPMWPRNVRRTLAKACARAGIEDLTVYELRHTVASLLIDQGASIYDVADQLGHANSRMLDRHYRHSVTDVIDTAARFAKEA